MTGQNISATVVTVDLIRDRRNMFWILRSGNSVQILKKYLETEAATTIT